MNQTELESENLPTLLKAADRLARVLCDGARAGRSKKQLLATMTEHLRSLRARCPLRQAVWPVMLLGPADARHICVVARRSSFLNLRRRLEEHCRRVWLKCPSCKAGAEVRSMGDAPDVAEAGRHATNAAAGMGGPVA